jgi:hypothetical protein
MVCVGEMENVLIIAREVLVKRRRLFEYLPRRLVSTPGFLLVG